MKKIYGLAALMLCILIVLSGCGKSEKKTDESKNKSITTSESYIDKLKIDKKNLTYTKVIPEYTFDVSNVTELSKHATHVFIGRVDSIDGCSTTVGSGEFSPVPEEYGKISVIKSIKGEIKNESIKYARPGGVISVAEYEKYAPEEAVKEEAVKNEEENRKASGKENFDKNRSFYEMRHDGDIKIEIGKIYLFFAMYNKETGYYFIFGDQYGSRKISGMSGDDKKAFIKYLDKDELKLRDNDTGKNESLKNFIEKYFS